MLPQTPSRVPWKAQHRQGQPRRPSLSPSCIRGLNPKWPTENNTTTHTPQPRRQAHLQRSEVGLQGGGLRGRRARGSGGGGGGWVVLVEVKPIPDLPVFPAPVSPSVKWGQESRLPYVHAFIHSFVRPSESHLSLSCAPGMKARPLGELTCWWERPCHKEAHTYSQGEESHETSYCFRAAGGRRFRWVAS